MPVSNTLSTTIKQIDCLYVFHFSYITCLTSCREYVVDLVGEPGNVHNPDLSINGAVCSSVPSPFQISHLKEFQQPDVNDVIDTQILKYSRGPDNPIYSGFFNILHSFKGFV